MKRLALALALTVTANAQFSIGGSVPTPTEAQRAQLGFDHGRAYYVEGFGTYYGGPIRIMAAKAEQTGSIVRFSGKVEIRTDTMTFQADEVDMDRAHHQFIPRGNVRVVPVLEPLK